MLSRIPILINIYVILLLAFAKTLIKKEQKRGVFFKEPEMT
jgi:hypothetical protein